MGKKQKCSQGNAVKQQFRTACCAAAWPPKSYSFGQGSALTLRLARAGRLQGFVRTQYLRDVERWSDLSLL